MTSKSQSLEYFRQYLVARALAPWIAQTFEDQARLILDGIGGLAGSWRTDYNECTYSSPQLINGVMVDLSTVDRVRAHHEAIDTQIVSV